MYTHNASYPLVGHTPLWDTVSTLLSINMYVVILVFIHLNIFYRKTIRLIINARVVLIAC